MEYIRWLLALPEPGFETAGKSEALLKWEHTERKLRSPLWWPMRWWENFEGRLFATMISARNSLWAVTLGKWLYIKEDRLQEAETVRFVASRTSIPLPRIWFTPSWMGTKYIVMSRIRGVDLSNVWHLLTDAKKEYIAEQLRGYILQLRGIPAPIGTSICSVSGGPVQSHRLIQWKPTCGPFRDEDHMNLQLRRLKPLDAVPEVVQKAHTKRHPIVFTHNDFFPRNIMIDTELRGHVVAIIDWESAGWFPAHWEYCISSNWGKWRAEQLEWMDKYVRKIVPVFEEEAEADRALMSECGYPHEQAP